MKRMMTTALACVLALGLSASSAHALAIGDANYLGNIVPGLPSGDDFEEGFIDTLIAMTPGTSADCDTNQDNTCTRSTNVFANLPAPASIVLPKIEGSNTVDVTGFAYILAKYGKGNDANATQVSHVWYVGNLSGNQTAPASSEFGGGLSHISRFNFASVPDGGVTLMLLGSALVGLGALRRRFEI
jgi:hypothetical protein